MDLNIGPEYVGGSFVCSYCGKLKNDLTGSPKYVGYKFYCDGCGNLKSLKGITRRVVDLYCNDCVYLLNFDCAETVVKNNFCCTGCYSLKDLSNAPKLIGNDFIAKRVKQFTKYEFEDCTKIKGNVFC